MTAHQLPCCQISAGEYQVGNKIFYPVRSVIGYKKDRIIACKQGYLVFIYFFSQFAVHVNVTACLTKIYVAIFHPPPHFFSSLSQPPIFNIHLFFVLETTEHVQL
jgi:hypothetical protein